MESTLTADVTYRHHRHPLSLTHNHNHNHNHNHHHRYHGFRRRSSFNTTAFLKSASFPSIRASFRNEIRQLQIPKFVTGVTVAAVFLSRLTVKPAIAVSSPPPVTIEEKTLEEHDINALTEIKIKNGKHEEVNQLVNLEPERQLLDESAKLGFETKSELKNVEKRILEICKTLGAKDNRWLETELAINLGNKYSYRDHCYKTWRKMDRIRDLKFVVAQILVLQGDYDEALKIYQELCEEEPQDLKPYLCQVIMYTLLGKKDYAENNFVNVENVISERWRWKKSDYIQIAIAIVLTAIMVDFGLKSSFGFKENKKQVS